MLVQTREAIRKVTKRGRLALTWNSFREVIFKARKLTPELSPSEAKGPGWGDIGRGPSA